MNASKLNEQEFIFNFYFQKARRITQHSKNYIFNFHKSAASQLNEQELFSEDKNHSLLYTQTLKREDHANLDTTLHKSPSFFRFYSLVETPSSLSHLVFSPQTPVSFLVLPHDFHSQHLLRP